MYSPLYGRMKEINKNKIDFAKQQKGFVEIVNDEQEITYYRCLNCCHLDEVDEIPQNTRYKLIVLHHWEGCNCACIYCPYKKVGVAGQPVYNPYDFIERLYEEDRIDRENLVVHFQGGDIGVLKNFDVYIDLFEKYGYARIDFCTNNIIYQPKIESVLRQGKGSLSLSLDCGTQKTYRKIKGVDKFDNYIENLKKYVACLDTPKLLMVNYIIVNGVNDNFEEVDKFLSLMAEIGVKYVGLRLDNKYVDEWSHSDEIKNCPKGLDKLIIYFFKTAKNYNLKIATTSLEQNNAMLKAFRALKKNNSGGQKNFSDKIMSFFRPK